MRILPRFRVHQIAVKSSTIGGHFPSDEAATKLLWPTLRNVMRKLVGSTREWKVAMNQFAILYGGRFTSARP